MVARAIVIPVDTARAVAHDACAYGAPLPLGAAIGADAGAMGEDLTPYRDRAGRAEGGSRTTIVQTMGLCLCLCLCLGLGLARGCTGSGDGGGVHAR